MSEVKNVWHGPEAMVVKGLYRLVAFKIWIFVFEIQWHLIFSEEGRGHCYTCKLKLCFQYRSWGWFQSRKVVVIQHGTSLLDYCDLHMSILFFLSGIAACRHSLDEIQLLKVMSSIIISLPCCGKPFPEFWLGLVHSLISCQGPNRITHTWICIFVCLIGKYVCRPCTRPVQYDQSNFTAVRTLETHLWNSLTHREWRHVTLLKLARRNFAECVTTYMETNGRPARASSADPDGCHSHLG